MKKTVAWALASIILFGAQIGIFAETTPQTEASQAREIITLLDGLEEKVATIEAAADKGSITRAQRSELTEATRLLDFIEKEAEAVLTKDGSLKERVRALRDRISKLQSLARTLRDQDVAEESRRVSLFRGRPKSSPSVVACRVASADHMALGGVMPASCPPPMFPQQEPWNREGYAHLQGAPGNGQHRILRRGPAPDGLARRYGLHHGIS